MRRRGEIDELTGEHVQLDGGVSKALEVRQMRMKIEGRYAVQKI